MKKIIDGKLYDTGAAEYLAEANSPRAYPGDFAYWHEELYRTQRGAYFLHGKGGASSSWAVPLPGNARGGSEDLRPLTDDEAREWAERWLTADEYVEIFGEPEAA